MNKKTINRVNGGVSIYYGISSVIAAIAGFIGTGIWLYKVFMNQTNFSWGTLIALTSITIVMALIGYSILRVGYEEIEK